MKRADAKVQGLTAWLRPLLVLFVLIFGFSVPSSAFRIAGHEVVVPVIAHNPGLYGTQWRTDLWIENFYGDEGQLTLSFYPEGGSVVVRTMSIDAYRGIFLPDIVLQTFGMDDVKGMLIVTSPDVRIEARGRIFNVGGRSGEYGQSVFGISLDDLRRQGVVSGLSLAEGSRVSFGIANPNDHEITVQAAVRDRLTGTWLRSLNITLGPHSIAQFSNIQSLWDIPAAQAISIQCSTEANEDPFFAYASVVQNDTGDAIFLFGTSPNV